MQSNSAYWPDLSAHQNYWEHHNNPYVYQYDPADDGPEVETITRINWSHPHSPKDRDFVELLHEFIFLKELKEATLLQ